MHGVHEQALDAVLASVSALLGMDLVLVAALRDDRWTVAHIHHRPGAAPWPAFAEGQALAGHDLPCAALADGDPWCAGDDAAAQCHAGVALPGQPREERAFLCGLAHSPVEVAPSVREPLSHLARAVALHRAAIGQPDLTVRRTPTGWRIGATDVDDLPTAMTLSDLLCGDPGAPARPERGQDGSPLDEEARLRHEVAQLEHALAARVVIEQAIGVLSERRHTSPRSAFDALRAVARRSGRRVREVAQEVVASAGNPGANLPPELAAPVRPAPVPSPPGRRLTLPPDRAGTPSLSSQR
jgi:hypothetical protein